MVADGTPEWALPFRTDRRGARCRHRHRVRVVRPQRYSPGGLEGALPACAVRPGYLADLLELWDRYVEDNGVIIGSVSVYEVDAEAQ